MSGWMSVITNGLLIAILSVLAEGFMLLNKNERKKVIQLIQRK